ncbi:hypothetical protein [Mucilaginibacter sp. L196]|uniref:hypothetical protein n=1 Tax=Mucilaginibacter sp. L196 TaxID=1641870 RepID=UPI00131D8E35|nr:hypothetical protein [Mucilaginibacter sp. L196]
MHTLKHILTGMDGFQLALTVAELVATIVIASIVIKRMVLNIRYFIGLGAKRLFKK